MTDRPADSIANRTPRWINSSGYFLDRGICEVRLTQRTDRPRFKPSVKPGLVHLIPHHSPRSGPNTHKASPHRPTPPTPPHQPAPTAAGVTTSPSQPHPNHHNPCTRTPTRNRSDDTPACTNNAPTLATSRTCDSSRCSRSATALFNICLCSRIASLDSPAGPPQLTNCTDEAHTLERPPPPPLGVSLSEYYRRATRESADQVLAERSRIVLTRAKRRASSTRSSAPTDSRPG
jgi:hypothetical protein